MAVDLDMAMKGQLYSAHICASNTFIVSLEGKDVFMQCPRCGNQWDVSRSPCSRCGLLVRLPGRSRETIRIPVPSFLQSATSDAGEMRPAVDSQGQTALSVAQSRSGVNTPSPEKRAFCAGSLLHSDRYRLQKAVRHQQWAAGVSETLWFAQDALRGGAEVLMCEVELPESGSMQVQAMLRTATIALTSVGRHPRVPTLWDAFSENEHLFFVFEPVTGETLFAHMRRAGHILPEAQAVECCMQLLDILELLAQQSPPLVHGLIRPEHIALTHAGTQYMLINFSVVLAAGARQYVTGLEHVQFSPYAAPEFSHGMIDMRADLYSLLATAYHMVVGSIKTRGDGTLPSAQLLNPDLSPLFASVLMKGLHPQVAQRYQQPAALRQELLTIYAGYRSS